MARWEEIFLSGIEDTSREAVNIKDISYGTVESLNPLVINDEGLPLYKDNLLINEDLLPHNKLIQTATVDVGDDTKTYNNIVIKTSSRLSVGDIVALKEVNDSTKIVLCKVVKGRDII